MNEAEVGRCECCGAESVVLTRKYFYYEVECECCSGDTHFHIARHCNDCKPKEPNNIRVVLSTDKYNMV